MACWRVSGGYVERCLAEDTLAGHVDGGALEGLGGILISGG